MAAPSTRLPCLGCWLILVAFAGLRAYAAGGAQNAPSPAAPPAVGSLREARTPEWEAPLPESAPAPEVASRADYRVDLWTTDQGLPQNTVQSLHQTQDGYLWVGTQSGLARFDGL